MTFPLSDNEPQSDKSEPTPLSQNHSPHEVKVTHIQMGSSFFLTAITGQLKTEERGSRSSGGTRIQKGNEENARTKVHFQVTSA